MTTGTSVPSKSPANLSVSARESVRQRERSLDFKAIQSARENAQRSEPQFAETGHSWVRLTFSVDEQGKVQTIKVVESCVKPEANSSCIDSDVNDRYAMGQIRRNRYTQPGTQEEVVFIPPSSR